MFFLSERAKFQNLTAWVQSRLLYCLKSCEQEIMLTWLDIHDITWRAKNYRIKWKEWKMWENNYTIILKGEVTSTGLRHQIGALAETCLCQLADKSQGIIRESSTGGGDYLIFNWTLLLNSANFPLYGVYICFSIIWRTTVCILRVNIFIWVFVCFILKQKQLAWASPSFPEAITMME